MKTKDMAVINYLKNRAQQADVAERVATTRGVIEGLGSCSGGTRRLWWSLRESVVRVR